MSGSGHRMVNPSAVKFQFTDLSGEKLAEEQLQEVLKQLSLDEYVSVFEEQEVL